MRTHIHIWGKFTCWHVFGKKPEATYDKMRTIQTVTWAWDRIGDPGALKCSLNNFTNEWAGISSTVYSRLTHSVPRISSGCTATLSRIKYRHLTITMILKNKCILMLILHYLYHVIVVYILEIISYCFISKIEIRPCFLVCAALFLP